MNDRNDEGRRPVSGSRRNRPAWIIGAVLLVLAAVIALRGAFEEVNEDGSSNSDRAPAATNG